VKLGVAALGGDFDAVIVALADQPLVGCGELQELLAAFAQRPVGTDVVHPEVDGERGNPVAFSGELIRAASGRRSEGWAARLHRRASGGGSSFCDRQSEFHSGSRHPGRRRAAVAQPGLADPVAGRAGAGLADSPSVVLLEPANGKSSNNLCSPAPVPRTSCAGITSMPTCCMPDAGISASVRWACLQQKNAARIQVNRGEVRP